MQVLYKTTDYQMRSSGLSCIVWLQSLMFITVTILHGTYSLEDEIVITTKNGVEITCRNLSKFGECFCTNGSRECKFSYPSLNLSSIESDVDSQSGGGFECCIKEEDKKIECSRKKIAELDNDYCDVTYFTGCNFSCIKIYWKESKVKNINSSLMEHGNCSKQHARRFIPIYSTTSSLPSVPTSTSLLPSVPTSTSSLPSVPTSSATITISISICLAVALIVLFIVALFYIIKRIKRLQVKRNKDLSTYYSSIDGINQAGRDMSPLPKNQVISSSNIKDYSDYSGLIIEDVTLTHRIDTTEQTPSAMNNKPSDDGNENLDIDDTELVSVYSRLREHDNNSSAIYNTLQHETEHSNLETQDTLL